MASPGPASDRRVRGDGARSVAGGSELSASDPAGCWASARLLTSGSIRPSQVQPGQKTCPGACGSPQCLPEWFGAGVTSGPPRSSRTGDAPPAKEPSASPRSRALVATLPRLDSRAQHEETPGAEPSSRGAQGHDTVQGEEASAPGEGRGGRRGSGGSPRASWRRRGEGAREEEASAGSSQPSADQAGGGVGGGGCQYLLGMNRPTAGRCYSPMTSNRGSQRQHRGQGCEGGRLSS